MATEYCHSSILAILLWRREMSLNGRWFWLSSLRLSLSKTSPAVVDSERRETVAPGLRASGCGRDSTFSLSATSSAVIWREFKACVMRLSGSGVAALVGGGLLSSTYGHPERGCPIFGLLHFLQCGALRVGVVVGVTFTALGLLGVFGAEDRRFIGIREGPVEAATRRSICKAMDRAQRDSN